MPAMRGLVAYDDDSLSDREDQSPASPNTSKPNDSALSAHKSDGSELNKLPVASSDQLQRNANASAFSSASSSKPAVIIRRHAPAKPHIRTRAADDIVDQAGPSVAVPARAASQEQGVNPQPTRDSETSTELARLRKLLRPPPIRDVEDWGIPPEPDLPCDEAIETKIKSFLALKRDPHNPRHFNDSLMSNRAFRNPHLYAKLVEFVDVDERTTNFPKGIWDPMDVKEEWYADRLAEAQKVRSEATTASQSSSAKRSHIEFAAAHMTASSSAQQLRQSASESKPARYQPYGVPPRSGAATKGERVLGGGYGRGKSRWG